jgi:hypothetical protein
MKADEKKREKLMTMVMSPLSLNFEMTRPLCNMQLGSPYQLAKVEFRVVAKHISTRDLVAASSLRNNSKSLAKNG